MCGADVVLKRSPGREIFGLVPGLHEAGALDACVSFRIVGLFVRFEMLVGIEGLCASFVVAAVRFCPWWCVSIADMGS